MSRLPYTQTWMMMVDRDVGGQTVSGLEPVGSSHIVLNQGDNGEAVGIREQVGAILAVARAWIYKRRQIIQATLVITRRSLKPACFCSIS